MPKVPGRKLPKVPSKKDFLAEIKKIAAQIPNSPAGKFYKALAGLIGTKKRELEDWEVLEQKIKDRDSKMNKFFK